MQLRALIIVFFLAAGNSNVHGLDSTTDLLLPDGKADDTTDGIFANGYVNDFTDTAVQSEGDDGLLSENGSGFDDPTLSIASGGVEDILSNKGSACGPISGKRDLSEDNVISGRY